jgi:pyridoxine kinase
MLATHSMGEYELQVVAAQDKIVHPTHHFPAVKL